MSSTSKEQISPDISYYDPKTGHITRRQSIREGRWWAIAGSVAAIGGMAIAALVINHNRGQAADTREVNRWVRTDGFTSAAGVDLQDYTSTISSLTLGKCSFDAVSFEHDKTGITSYSMVIGTAGEGKFKSDTTHLEFDNAAELEKELPGINCFPKD